MRINRVREGEKYPLPPTYPAMKQFSLPWSCRCASFLAAVLCLSVAAAQETKPTPVEAARAAQQQTAAACEAARRIAEEKAAAAKAGADQATADKAMADKLAAELIAAQKLAEEKAAAVKAGAEKAAVAKAAADKAAAEKAAADKDLADKQAAARAAQETLLAEEAYAASEAVVKARTGRDEAEKQRAAKEALVQQKAPANGAAAQAAEKANAEKAAADKVLAEALAAEKAAADKVAALVAGGDKTPPAELEAAKAAAAKGTEARTTAEKAAAEKNTAAAAAAEAVKAAAAAYAAAVAEREQAAAAVMQSAASIPPALDQEAAAKAILIGGLKPLPGAAWDYAKARHLLWHAGFGGSAEEVARLHAMGLHAAVDYLVDYQKLPEPSVPLDVRLPERETPYEHRLTEPERSKLGSDRTTRRFQQLAQMRTWWLRRMAESQRPLEEKLTLLWHGHFAVSFTKNENPHILIRQNRLFRDYAAGDFSGLLRGIAQDPAMIAYLDNQVNFKGAGNENLGREILELFSMGEGQGYSEQDLREASRALTGYSYEYTTGQFKFIATRHDETPKTIFGQAGNWGGDELVDLILQQPATAKFAVTKLYRFFVHDHPSNETLETLAGALRLSHYSIAPVLQNLFLSEEFYSPAAMGAHIKSPAELMAGAIRALGLTNVNYAAAEQAMQEMGQTLFEPPNVKGWDGGRDWINTSRLLTRYNALSALLDQCPVDLAAGLEKAGAILPDAIADYLTKTLLVTPLPEPKRAELVRFLGTLPPATEWAAKRDAVNARLRAAAAALLSTPEFQVF